MIKVEKPLERVGVKGMTASLLLLAVASLTGFAGCAVNAEKQSTPAPSAPEAAKPADTAAKAPVPEGAVLKLQDLSVREERGQTTMLIRFSQPITQYRHFQLPQPSRIVLDIFGAAKDTVAAESFRIGTSWVSTLRLSYGEGNLRLSTEIAAAQVPPYTITPEEGGLKIVIGNVDPKAIATKNVTLVRAGVRGDLNAGEAATGQSSGFSTALDQVQAEEKKYTDQKISLEFKDADIKNIFRLLAELSGKNIVVTDDVNRKVTIRLVETPWDQALDLLLNTNGLVKDEVGNVIRISTPGRLKSERDDRDAAGTLQTAYFTVNYARVIKGKEDKDATDKDLVEKIKLVLSKDGKVEADQRTNTLIVRDTKVGIERVQRVLAQLDRRTPQVLIESNLVETSPSFSRALGVEMDTLFNNKHPIQTSTRFLADSPFVESTTPAPLVPGPLVNPATGFRFGYFGNQIASILSAAEKEGNIKIVSRPSVTTLNNVESSIEIGEVIRVKKSAATVGESGGIETFRAGIILTVTPQVSADGFVLLKINVKASEFDFSKTVDGIPRETTREAKASIMVRDGETVVIGGIMKDRGSESESGVPYLKEIPVFGWLFKKSSWTKDLTELTVFITPRISEAGSENLPSAEQLWRNQLKQTEGPAPAISTSKKP